MPLFKVLFVSLLELFFSFILILLCVNLSIPDIETAKEIFKHQYIEFYDDQGVFFHKSGDELILIDMELIPPSLINAIVSIEDQQFFKHNGLNYKSILKNFYINFSTKKVIGGGSTITQQLAKNILQNQGYFDTNDRSILRKIKEILLTYKLEKQYSKNEILYFYLNRIFFGKSCYGVESASQYYFKKSASALNIYESALLAAILQSPSKYSSNKKKWRTRAKIVLKRMKNLKYISEDEEKNFKNFKIPNFAVQESNIHFFINFVIQNIPKKYRKKDLKIKTTFNSKLYENANDSLHYAQEAAGDLWNSDEASFVLINNNGAIKVLIGGLNYSESNFNIAVQAKRPSGSVAKFYTYLTALEMGLNPKSLLDDSPYSFGIWKPSNYLHKTQGKVQVDVAFAQSINSTSVRILEIIQPENVIKMIERLGIKEEITPSLSLALGSLNTSLFNLTKSFLPIINKGYAPKLYCIEEIIDKNTNEVLYTHKENYKKILDERTTYYMWNMMKRTISPYGTGKNLIIQNKNFGGKSGTSNENKDIYFILANKYYCIGCWFGRRDFKPMINNPKNNLSILALNKFFENMNINIEDIEFDLNIDDINEKKLIELI